VFVGVDMFAGAGLPFKSQPLLAPKLQLYDKLQLILFGVETVNVFVRGMPQVKATAFGAKVNVGFGLLIVM
jgi:hypothetical protein